jgi:hypothetical protein
MSSDLLLILVLVLLGLAFVGGLMFLAVMSFIVLISAASNGEFELDLFEEDELDEKQKQKEKNASE